MNLSSLKRPNTPYSRKRMGRGAGSGKGTTGGRGTKGQRARTGGKGGLKLMGLKNTIMKLPKMGGFNSRHPKMQVVNLEQVNAIFKESEEVTPRNLEKHGLIENPAWKVKLLGQGALTKKLNFRVHAASASAKAAVEKAGGKLNIIPVKSRITQKPKESKAETK